MKSATEHFARQTAALTDAIAFVEKFIDSSRVPSEMNSLTAFVVEELFTNMVKYNPTGPPTVTITLQVTDGKLVIIMEDHSVKPFDLTKAKPVNTHLPLNEMKPGGLGIHLVRQMMDEVHFDFDGEINRTTLIKYLENNDV